VEIKSQSSNRQEQRKIASHSIGLTKTSQDKNQVNWQKV